MFGGRVEKDGEKVSLFGALAIFIFILWCFVSVLLMRGFPDYLSFMRSMNFGIICAGYIIILSVFYMLKNVLRRLEEE